MDVMLLLVCLRTSLTENEVPSLTLIQNTFFALDIFSVYTILQYNVKIFHSNTFLYDNRGALREAT